MLSIFHKTTQRSNYEPRSNLYYTENKLFYAKTACYEQQELYTCLVFLFTDKCFFLPGSGTRKRVHHTKYVSMEHQKLLSVTTMHMKIEEACFLLSL